MIAVSSLSAKADIRRLRPTASQFIATLPILTLTLRPHPLAITTAVVIAASIL